MSVPIPIVSVNPSPVPQFIPRSRREAPTRDIINARNIEVHQSGTQIQQGFFRPEPATSAQGLRAYKTPLPTQDRSVFRGGETNMFLDNRAYAESIPEMPQASDRKPEKSLTGPRNTSFFDQAGIATRNQAPISIPAPMYEPNAPKLEGNPFFDQYAASFDPRNVARELNSAVKEDKMERGRVENKAILSRSFSNRNVPQGFADQSQLNSLQAFEMLRPKIDDSTKAYK